MDPAKTVDLIMDTIFSWHEDRDPKYLTKAHKLIRELDNWLRNHKALPGNLTRLVGALEIVTGDLETEMLAWEEKSKTTKENN